MARPLRVNVAGGWYHVVSRGNGGDKIFGNDTTGGAFWFGIGAAGAIFGGDSRLVLMDNHHHLLLRCREANLSEAIRWLQVVTRDGSIGAPAAGTPVPGTIQTVLLLEESALDEVGRYIHLNPVRVGGLWAIEAGSTAGTGVGL